MDHDPALPETQSVRNIAPADGRPTPSESEATTSSQIRTPSAPYTFGSKMPPQTVGQYLPRYSQEILLDASTGKYQ